MISILLEKDLLELLLLYDCYDGEYLGSESIKV